MAGVAGGGVVTAFSRPGRSLQGEEMKTGVYQIRNMKNGKVYVGSSASGIDWRWWSHLSQLRRGIHKNVYLQRSWNKNGEQTFVFEVLEECPPERCVAREQYWIDHLRSANPRFGYNRNPTAGSMLSFRHSEETKRLVGEKSKGRRHTEDTKKRISKRISVVMQGNKHFEGRQHTEGARQQIAEAAVEQWKNEEHRKDVARKNRKNAKRQWADPAYREKHRQAMIEWARKRRSDTAAAAKAQGKAV